MSGESRILTLYGTSLRAVSAHNLLPTSFSSPCAALPHPRHGRNGHGRIIPRSSMPSMTYRTAGVDIDAGEALVSVSSRSPEPPPGPAYAGLGGFGACSTSRRPDSATRCWSPPPTASAPSCRSPSTPAATTRSASTGRDVRQRPRGRAPNRCCSSTIMPPAKLGREPARVIAGIAPAAVGRLRLDRRRNRRDAGHVRRRRLRPRRLRGGRGRTRRDAPERRVPGDIVLGLAAAACTPTVSRWSARIVEQRRAS